LVHNTQPQMNLINFVSVVSGIVLLIMYIVLCVNVGNTRKDAKEQIRLLKKIAGEKEVEEETPIQEPKPEKTHW